MSNTYTQIHLQCVFAVRYRDAVINPSWKERLHNYIIAIIQNNGHKVLAINSMPDHLHLFFGMRPNQLLSDLIQLVKEIHRSGLINKNWLQENSGGKRVMAHSPIQNHILMP